MPGSPEKNTTQSIISTPSRYGAVLRAADAAGCQVEMKRISPPGEPPLYKVRVTGNLQRFWGAITQEKQSIRRDAITREKQSRRRGINITKGK